MGKRPHNPALDVMIDNFDGGDPWGSAMAMGFAVGDVAVALGNSAVPAILDYSPGLAASSSLVDLIGGEDFDTSALASAVQSGEVSEVDLERCARILSRYLDLLKRAGRDY